jgi:hypothetical protein
VVGPPPEITALEVAGNGKLRLKWKKYICTNADKILIYRKIDSSQIQLDTCFPGMPVNAGFELISEVSGSDSSFVDDNKGLGLKKGPSYCYRIVARFPNPAGGESLVSNEICQNLPLDIPLLVNVDVEKTDASQGRILVRWTNPFFLDTNIYKPPYQTELLRLQNNRPLLLVRSTTDLSDTSFEDSNLNTLNETYTYRLRFRYGPLQNLVDSAEQASAVRLELKPGIKKIQLDWTAATPWTNNGFYHLIFRKTDGDFVLIDSIISQTGIFQYVDEGKFQNLPLEDTTEYCYYVRAAGTYSNTRIREPLFNKSQEACAFPSDTSRPCVPHDFVVQDPVNFDCNNCENLRNQTEYSRTLKWKNIKTDTCGRDVARYNIYYTRYEEDPLALLATTTDTFFVHSSLTTLSGCYAVSSVDRSGNESKILDKVCSDNCFRYDLPNLITLNKDGKNDLFTPICISKAFVESVHFEVFNRWGQKIFEDDVIPEINWGGISENNTTIINDGIYFYHARVKGKRLRRKDEDMGFKGWIWVTK